MVNQKLTNRGSLGVSDSNDIIHVVKGTKSYQQKMSVAVDDKVKLVSDQLVGVASGYRGFLAIADVPTEDGYYYASESGTYANAGGLVVSLSGKITIITISDTQTTFEKLEIPIDTLGYRIVRTIGEFDALVTAGDSGVWIILDDITLTANTTIPSDVTLFFNGGKINLNGFTLTGSDTKIDANENTSIFSGVASFLGEWSLKVIYPEWFGAVGDGITDDSTAIQSAVNFIKQLADNNSNTNSLPFIDFTSGNYQIDSVVITRPYIKWKCFGTCKISVAATAYIDCRLESTDVLAERRSSNKTYWIDGGFLISGVGRDTVGTIGLKVGCVSSSTSPFGESGMNGVTILNFETGMEFRNYDFYMQTFERIHIENCYYHIITTDGGTFNSGENMQFRNCIFAGATHVLTVNTPGWRFYFHGCSFDFNSDATVLLNKDYTQIKFNMCYFEKSVDGGFVKTTSSKIFSSVEIVGCEVLPRTYEVPAIEANAQPMVMLTGEDVQYNINSMFVLNERAASYPYDIYLISPEAGKTSINGVKFVSSRMMLGERFAKNTNFNFESSTAGDIMEADEVTRFELNSRSAGISAVVSTEQAWSGINSIKLTFASLTEFYMMQTKFVPVAGGDLISSHLMIYAGGTTGNLSTKNRFYYYDEDKVLISTTLGFDTANDTIYDDINQQQYDGTRNYWIPTKSVGDDTVPAGAVYVKAAFNITNVVGSIYLDNLMINIFK